MVTKNNLKKEKPLKISEASLKSLKILKAQLDFQTYDDLINYFIIKEATI
jgi:hypothetical protein